MLKPVLFIVGPTGSGKSKLALMLARKLNGEIVSADSMQIYRGMNIGTAKPTKKEQRIVRHYLLDELSPRSECTVFKYRKLALNAIRQISKRNRLPIVAGGTGLYLKALIDGLNPLPGKQAGLRKRLAQENTAELYERLKKLNPATKIHPNDQKRIIRALEIAVIARRPQGRRQLFKRRMAARSSGAGRLVRRSNLSLGLLRPSGPRNENNLESYGFRSVIFGLDRNRKELYARIEKRVDQMFRAGWIREVKRLKKTGLSKTAKFAIGYQEIAQFLDGKKSENEIRPEIKKRTRHLAKRQMTWFRRESRIKWYFVSGGKYADVIREILNDFKRMSPPRRRGSSILDFCLRGNDSGTRHVS